MTPARLFAAEVRIATFMDMTSFGYRRGTGQGEWFVCVQHQIAGEK